MTNKPCHTKPHLNGIIGRSKRVTNEVGAVGGDVFLFLYSVKTNSIPLVWFKRALNTIWNVLKQRAVNELLIGAEDMNQAPVGTTS